jgi:hypothetical protein
MKTKEEYIKTYSQYVDSAVNECYGDGDDLCAGCLSDWLDEDSKRIDILNAFDLGPKSLAEIISAIGGAEFYEFDHLNFLLGLIHLYPYMQGAGHAHEEGIDYPELKEIIKKLFPKEYQHIPELDSHTYQSISLDRAIGYIIQAEQYLYHRDYLTWPPSGDDTYFDYYPGTLFYFGAINEWFLNSNNRLI